MIAVIRYSFRTTNTISDKEVTELAEVLKSTFDGEFIFISLTNQDYYFKVLCEEVSHHAIDNISGVFADNFIGIESYKITKYLETKYKGIK